MNKPPSWREAKRYAEQEDAAGEVAAWLVVGFALFALLGIYIAL